MEEQNLIFQIYNADGSYFHGLSIKSSTYISQAMAISDNIEGYIYYPTNELSFTFKKYITYNGVNYYMKIDEPPTIVMKGLLEDNNEAKGMTKYTIKFYHPMVLLFNIPFTDVAVSVDEKKYKTNDTSFYFKGTLSNFLQKLNVCLSNTPFTCALQSGFVDDGTQSDVIQFDNQMISSVLGTLYDTFKVPFVFDGYKILFGTPSAEIYANGETSPFVFKLGQGLGLKDNDRTPKNNTIVTRVAGCGSSDNIPYGYPKIKWTGDQSWTYTINNDPSQANSYPIVDGVIDGETVKLINHPFTRKVLMPTVYTDSVNKKVNPNATGYNPDIELVDYYDALDSEQYENVINPNSPSYYKKAFDGSDSTVADIKPSIKGAKYNNQEIDILKSVYPCDASGTQVSNWDDSKDKDGNYNQSYFKVEFYPLGFDLYAMAAATSAMSVNTTSGACNGCKFDLAVDWDVVKTNFYFTKEDGTIVFDPNNTLGTHRDYTKFPDSTNQSITVMVKKDTDTFGTLMPNIYQQPAVGDTFVFIGIDMPQAYITEKQLELDAAMKQWMKENNIAYYEYPFKFDEYFFTQHPDILNQIKPNCIIRFEYAGNVMALSIQEMSITWGDKSLPTYNITLTDDVSVNINQIGEVTNGLSKLGSQVAAIQAYYNINIVDELNKRISKVSDDTANGKITFKDISTFVKGFNIADSLIDNIITSVNSVSEDDISLMTSLKSCNTFLRKDKDDITTHTITAPTFIGELNGNAATATKLKTARTIWGQPFDGSGNVSGRLSLDESSVYWKEPNFGDQFAIVPSFPEYGDSNLLCFQSAVGDYGTTPSLSTKMVIAGASGNVGIGTTTPAYKLDVNGTLHAAGAVTLSSTLTAAGLINANGGTHTTALTATALSTLAATDILGDAQLSARVMSPDYVSQTTGWGITRAGAADFRNLYADELRVQAFTADISQALAGSDYLTKSVSKLSANFIVPAVNSTVRIIVDDIEGMPATQCFTNGDYIRFRAFNRTSGLIISNVWGTVTLDTTFGTNGFSNGTQAYTFTCTQTTGVGLTVFKGSEVLDYGISGSGLITRTTLDAMGSPYEQIATWVNDPSNGNNYTVHARLGNLNGIANCNGHGIYTDNGFFTGKIVIGDLTKTSNYLSFDNVNGLQINLGGTSVATTTDVSTAVNGIQIGGRNYMRTDLSPYIINANSDNDLTIVPYTYNGISGYRLTKTKNSDWGSVISWNILNKNLDKNSIYSFSIYVANLGNVSLNYPISFQNEDSSNLAFNGSINIPLKFNGRIKLVGKSINSSYDPTLNNTSLVSVILAVGWDIFIAQPMLEIGSKSTDYSPSIEDVANSISNAQSTAISTAASNAEALYVTQSAYSSQVTILQNSINAKVSQTDFNALGTRVGTAESTITQHSTAIASKVAQTDYTGNTIASLINQTATTIAIQANKINLVGAVTISAIDKSSVTPSALGAATPTDVTTAVDNIQIGGRNLFTNTKTFSNYVNLGYWTKENDLYNGCNVYSMNGMWQGLYHGNDLYNAGTYTFSFWIKGTSDIGIVQYYDSNNVGPVNGSVLSVTTDWKRVSITFTITSPTILASRIEKADTNGTVYICGYKLEEGNKATTWTPAPEDVDSSISKAQQAAQTYATTNCVQVGLSNAPDAIKNQVLAAAHGNFSYIDGSSIYTGTLNANQVTAGYISADRIAANSITTDKLATNVLSVGNISGLGSLSTQNSLAYDSSYITNKPTSLSAINQTEGTKLGGIAAGATVGATWGTNVTGIPTNLSSLNGTEGIKNTLITISENGTLNGAGGGQVTVSGIGACTPTQAQGYATTSQNSAQDNLATNLGYTNYSDLVTKAASTDFGTLVVGGYLNTALIQAQAISTNMLAAGSITADKINANSVSASIANVISLDASRITTGKLSADRIDSVSVVAKGLVAQTIDAQNATIKNLKMETAEVSGTITATAGSIGPFTISSNQLIADSNSDEMLLNAEKIRFTRGTTSAVHIGGDILPLSMGGLMACPMRVEESRSTSGNGNAGIYISVTGSAIDDSSDYASNSALYITKGVISGLRPKIRRLASSQTLSVMDHTIIDISSSSDSYYTFPSGCEDGQEYVLISNSRGIWIRTNSTDKIQNGTDNNIYTGAQSVLILDHTYAICVYDAYNTIWRVRPTRQ